MERIPWGEAPRPREHKRKVPKSVRYRYSGLFLDGVGWEVKLGLYQSRSRGSTSEPQKASERQYLTNHLAVIESLISSLYYVSTNTVFILGWCSREVRVLLGLIWL